MGKASRQKRRQEREKQKRSRKEAMRTLYAEWRDKGINQKSRRHRNQDNGSGHKHEHPFGTCGNVGCKRCFPVLHERIKVLAKEAAQNAGC